MDCLSLKKRCFELNAVKFVDEKNVDNEVFLIWEMRLQLKSPKKIIHASGVSVLHLKEKIIFHRDYFDVGELFYENIPVLGILIKWIKNKITK